MRFYGILHSHLSKPIDLINASSSPTICMNRHTSKIQGSDLLIIAKENFIAHFTLTQILKD